MNRGEASHYELPLSKQHESKDATSSTRTKERGRAVGPPKKTLQTRFHADPKEPKEIRAA
jgi:hypothetical protein